MVERGPYLVPGHSQQSLGRQCVARLPRCQVGAGVRLRKALAPIPTTGAERGQKALLLRVAAERDQRRTDQTLADVPHASRAAGARILLVEDHLSRDRQATAAGLFRPADTGPATRRKLALPPIGRASGRERRCPSV